MAEIDNSLEFRSVLLDRMIDANGKTVASNHALSLQNDILVRQLAELTAKLEAANQRNASLQDRFLAAEKITEDLKAQIDPKRGTRFRRKRQPAG